MSCLNKKNFAEVSKNLVMNTDLEMDHQIIATFKETLLAQFNAENL